MDNHLLKKKMTAAWQYSYTRLSLNYYTFFETVADTAGLDEETQSCIQALTKVMKGYYDRQEVLPELKELRARLTREVEVLTAYADCFQIYEYVLNRVERVFRTLPDSSCEDADFINRLLAFITDTKDATVMNGRIAQIIGQLPVRLTRQKFFSLITEGLSVYVDSPRKNLEDMMYLLRTESMVSLPADMEAGHKELFEILEQYRHMDVKAMTKEGFEEATAKLAYVSNLLSDRSGFCVLFQEVINDLYVLLLAESDSVIEVKEEELFRFFVSAVLRKFRHDDFSPIDDSVIQRMTELEGRQEAYSERYMRLGLPEETRELSSDNDYIRLVNVDLLLSGSSFVALRERGVPSAEEDEPADRVWVKKTEEAFFAQLEEQFDSMERPVVRAVMAKILSSLPVYFNSIDEISSYIRGSLDACTDINEKETSKELLELLMKEEGSGELL